MSQRKCVSKNASRSWVRHGVTWLGILSGKVRNYSDFGQSDRTKANTVLEKKQAPYAAIAVS